MTPAQRKRLQRERDRLLGWAEVTVRVDRARVEDVRRYAGELPPPPPPTDPAQLSMLDALDAAIRRDASQPDNGGSETQGRLI